MAVDGSLIFDTKINTKGFQTGRKSIINSLDGMKSAVLKLGATLGAVFGVGQLINFGKTCVSVAREAGDALLGLKSIVEGQGRDFSQAQNFINDYISDGLVPMANAVTAYKNLASRGYDDSQIQSVMLALKDSAAYGRQASLTLGYAIQSATEGLKNENSILVDNAGVTKNVSVMWKEYADSIGTTYTNLTKQQKIQAEVNGILTETRFQTGDASRMADSFSGQLSRLTTNFTKFRIAVGDVLINTIRPVIAYLNEAIQSMTKFVTTFSKVLGLKSYSNSASEQDISKNSGTSYKDSGLLSETSQITDEIADSVKNQNALTEAVEETANAEERSLAGFDEINTITDKTEIEIQPETVEDTDIIPAQTVEVEPVLTDSVKVTADVTPFELAMESAIQRIKSLLDKLLEPVKLAWDINEDELVSSAKSAVSKIKELIKSIGKSFVDVWTNGTGERFISNILVLLTDVFNIIGDIAKALQTAWNDNGTGEALIQSYFDRWNAVLELIHTIADDFREVWNNGTGIEVCKNIFEIITNINETVANLRERFALAWSENYTGKEIIQSILDIFNIILGTINDITADTEEWSEKLDFSPLLTAIQGLLESLEPLAENIGSGLEWFYKNVLLPLAGWTIEDVIPAFIDLLSGAIDVLNSVIEVFRPLAEWLWDKFLKPIAEWTGGVIVTVIEGIANALKGISDWISEHKEGVLNFLKFTGIFTAILVISNIVQTAISAFTAMGGIIAIVTGIATSLTPVITAISGALSLLTNPITLLIAMGLLLITHWDEVKTFFVELIEKIKAKISDIHEWLSEKIESAKELGKNIILGLINGIIEFSRNPKKWVKENIVDPFINVFKSLFGIHSPSTVMAELGGYIIAGLYNAISAGINQVTDIFSEILINIKNIFSDIGEWFKEIFSTAWENIKEIFSGVGEWFSGRWNDIVAVFSIAGEWFSEIFSIAWEQIQNAWSDVKKWFSDLWKGIKEVFSVVSDWFRSIFSKAWENIQKAWNNAVKWFSDIWDNIKKTFSKIDEWFREKFQKARDNINEIFSSIGNWFSDRWEEIKNIFSSVGEWFGERFRNAWDNITDIFSGIGNWFSDRWNDVTTSLSNVGEWFRDKFHNAWNNITGIFNGIGQWFYDRWNDITSVFSGVSDWFSEQFQSAYDNITGIFSNLGSWFDDIWENISDGAKTGLNWIIDKINDMIYKFNSFSFEMPGFLGGGTVGFNIPEIPHLAKGTVVPANYGEFLAVLGDNKKEREFVAPESALKNALIEAMSQINNTGDIVINVSMFPNERAFQQYVVKAGRNIQSRGGRVF